MAQKYVKANVSAVQKLCVQRCLTQEALADKAEVSVRTINNLMAGKPVLLDTFGRVAKALDTSVDSLFEGYEPPAVQRRGAESPPDHSEALSKQRIHITLNFGDNAPFNVESRKKFIENIIAQAIEAEDQIVVIEIIKGSTIVELDMSEEDALRLVAAFTEARLDSIDVEAIRLPPTSGPLAAALLQIIQPPGTPAHATAEPTTSEMTLTRTPKESRTFTIKHVVEVHFKSPPPAKPELWQVVAMGSFFLFVAIAACLIKIFELMSWIKPGPGMRNAKLIVLGLSIILTPIIMWFALRVWKRMREPMRELMQKLKERIEQ